MVNCSRAGHGGGKGCRVRGGGGQRREWVTEHGLSCDPRLTLGEGCLIAARAWKNAASTTSLPSREGAGGINTPASLFLSIRLLKVYLLVEPNPKQGNLDAVYTGLSPGSTAGEKWRVDMERNRKNISIGAM